MSKDLRELKLRKKQYNQYFSSLLNKHIEEGLDHDFGKDEYCLYCERYNEKMSEYLQLKKEIQKLEKKYMLGSIKIPGLVMLNLKISQEKRSKRMF
ncbi:hypothetical protein L3K57_15560 (plasmid) [Enterococcus faecium]|uniref:hypothetical protein n=1 Tax=Enterococcus faecium TaxID=1352 RepID=UPI001F1D4601|nr:hypothetical protein [Enterococcus faecium]UJV65221.1 hypothetical protein L3K57_15560 [Enterococcus faecium]